ncbi:hypothetical protein DRN75_01370 [Nanoarchaeota archaeon]|nr:MAG: hypothetical protein DRN75_01370 [Nanoarchaeota archaeon]
MILQYLKNLKAKTPGKAIAIEVEKGQKYFGVVKIGSEIFPYHVDMSKISEDMSEEEFDKKITESVEIHREVGDNLKSLLAFVVYNTIVDLLAETPERKHLEDSGQLLQEEYKQIFKKMGYEVSSNNYIVGIKEFKVTGSLSELL